MGYPIVKDFDSGLAAGFWEQVISNKGDYRVVFATKSSANAFRYKVAGFRARAREANHPTGLDAAPYVLRIREEAGQWVVIASKDIGLVGEYDFRSAADRERDARVDRMMEELKQREAAKANGPGEFPRFGKSFYNRYAPPPKIALAPGESPEVVLLSKISTWPKPLRPYVVADENGDVISGPHAAPTE